MEKYQVIKCPFCEAEYLPGEIFMPNYSLGAPKEVERDFTGKLLYFDGLEQDLKETYTCEYCNNRFDVYAKINYRTEESQKPKTYYTQKL